jgi:7-carboxy-7-deazaguanine synthase (Cx14CxxC type)
MVYAVKEIFKTLQGEGGQTGRAAVFCRFSGCNLWNGREQDRAASTCQFCDTHFVGTDGNGGGKFATAEELAQAIAMRWDGSNDNRMVVFTGGEPLLQLDLDLIKAMKAHHFFISVETNGTLVAPEGIDWLCVSPKANADFVQRQGTELKLIYPQPKFDPADFLDLPFSFFYLQPMDGPDRSAHTAEVVAYCKANPRWRMSIQTHKYIGID